MPAPSVPQLASLRFGVEVRHAKPTPLQTRYRSQLTSLLSYAPSAHSFFPDNGLGRLGRRLSFLPLSEWTEGVGLCTSTLSLGRADEGEGEGDALPIPRLVVLRPSRAGEGKSERSREPSRRLGVVAMASV